MKDELDPDMGKLHQTHNRLRIIERGDEYDRPSRSSDSAGLAGYAEFLFEGRMNHAYRYELVVHVWSQNLFIGCTRGTRQGGTPVIRLLPTARCTAIKACHSLPIASLEAPWLPPASAGKER